MIIQTIVQVFEQLIEYHLKSFILTYLLYAALIIIIIIDDFFEKRAAGKETLSFAQSIFF